MECPTFLLSCRQSTSSSYVVRTGHSRFTLILGAGLWFDKVLRVLLLSELVVQIEYSHKAI